VSDDVTKDFVSLLFSKRFSLEILLKKLPPTRNSITHISKTVVLKCKTNNISPNLKQKRKHKPGRKARQSKKDQTKINNVN